jgi:hypothetical protein
MLYQINVKPLGYEIVSSHQIQRKEIKTMLGSCLMNHFHKSTAIVEESTYYSSNKPKIVYLRQMVLLKEKIAYSQVEMTR